MDLATLVFKTETSELERANNLLKEIGVSASQMDVKLATAQKRQAQAEKLQASARLDNAKALEVEERAQTRKQKATEAATAATEKANKETTKSVGVLEKQEAILSYMTQGWSKGQSQVLAYAKATGVLGTEMETLKRVLDTQRSLMGSQPFDDSRAGIEKLKQQYKELTTSIDLYNSGIALSSQQASNYARDRQRITLSMREEGKSIKEIQQALAQHKQEYIDTANSVNRLADAQKVVQNQRREIVSATKAVVQEDQRMAAALSQVNSELSVGATDRLVKYENNLKKMGLAQDVVTQKLTAYKAQLRQVQAQEEARASQHLARSLSPQLTDIAVSLYSGQAPLTVLLQQGGQIADLFRLSGVEAANFGKAMRDAFTSMIPVMATVAKGVAGFVGGVFVDAGKGVTKFIAEMTGVAAVVEKTRYQLTLAAMAGESWAKALLWVTNAMGKLSVAAMTTAIGALLVSIGALAIGFKQVLQENDQLAQALALSGGALALTHTNAVAAVESLTKLGGTTGQATTAIAEMAKTGAITKNELLLVGEAAINLAKWSDQSIEETVKTFAKLKQKPVEALIEVAKQTGMVSVETIKMVEELEKSGKSADAAALAMKTYADVTKTQVSQMKENYNGFASFMITLGGKIKQFFSDTFKVLFLASDPTKEMEKQLANTQELINKYKGAVAYQNGSQDSAAVRRVKALEEQARMLSSQISAQVRLNAEKEKEIERNAESARLEEAKFKLFEKTETALDKQLAKTKSLAEYQDLYTKKKIEDLAKSANMNAENIKLSEDELKMLREKAKLEWQSKQKKHRTDPEEKYYENLMRSITKSSVDATGAVDNLTAAQKRMIELSTDPKFLALSESRQSEVMDILAKTAAQEKANRVDELRNKYLGQASMLGKTYYEELDKINQAVADGLGAEEADAMRKALQEATPFAKAMAQWNKENSEAIAKSVENHKLAMQSISDQNQELDYRSSLLGKSEEEQKKITIEYQRQKALAQAVLEREKALADIRLNPNFKTDQARVDANNRVLEEYEAKLNYINADAALKYAEEFQKQFDSIRNGITDSIVTALFEGGKAGRKKFRDLIVNELKKPVTLVVNAVVNTLLGNVIGSIVGGSAGSAGGLGGVGNLLGSLGSLGTTIAGGIGNLVGSVFGTGVGNVALGTSLGLGASSSAAAASAAAAAGGASTAGISSAGSLFSGIGSALPYIGAALSIFSLLSGLDDSGTYHTGGAARYSAAGGLTAGQSGADFNIGFGRVEEGKDTISAVSTLSKSLVEIFDGIAKTFGKTAGYEVATAFADDTSKDGAWGALAIRLQGQEVLNWNDFRQSKWAPKEFGDGEEGYKQYLAAVAKDTRQVILDMDLPSWAEDVLTEIGDSPSIETLTAAVQELGTLKAIYDDLTGNVVNFVNITDESFGKLVKQFSDVATMSTQIANYYDKYYTDYEKYNKLQKDVVKGFSDIGVAMPANRDEFRKLAEAQDLNTEAGRKMYAKLMALAGGFDELSSATDTLNEKRAEYTDKILEQEALILESQGKTAEAARKRRELLDAQRARENAALMAVNPELAKLAYQLWLLEDAASAYNDKVEKANDAYSALETAVNTQKTALNTQRDTVNALISNLEKIFDLLKQNVRDLYLQVDSTSTMLAAQGREVIASALAGNSVDYDTLNDAISSVRNQIDTTQYTTQFEQDKARLQLAADLANLQGVTDNELTVAKKQLAVLDEQLADLDKLLDVARQQLNAALGINTSVLSVSEALAELNATIIELNKPASTGTGTSTGSGTSSGGASFGGSPVGGGSGTSSTPSKYNQVISLGTAGVGYEPITDSSYISHLDTLNSIYQSYSGTGNVAGLLADIQAAGGTLDDLSALSGYFSSDWRNAAAAVGVQPFADGGVFTNGVVSKPLNFNMGLMGEAGSEAIMPLTNINGTLGVRAVKSSSEEALERRVENLSIELQAIAVNTSKVARILERVTHDGESLLVTTAP